MALSMDLRQRIVEAYEQKEGSLRQLAKRFKVGWISVWRLLKQYRLTGSIAPKPHGGGKRPFVVGENAKIFQELVQATPDLTLDELREQFKEKSGIALSCSTTYNTCQRYELKRKKKSAYAQERDREEVKKNEKNFRRK